MCKRHCLLVLSVVIGTAIWSCDTPVETDVQPPTLRVSPRADTTYAVGDTLAFSVQVVGPDGAQMDTVGVEWGVSDTSVAVLVGEGLLRARTNGTTAVLAELGESRDSASLVVQQRPAGIMIADTPDSLELEVGDSVALTATVTDARGAVIHEASTMWSSSDSSVVTVSQTGVAHAVDAGTAAVRAWIDTMGSAAVTIHNRLAGPDDMEIGPMGVGGPPLGDMTAEEPERGASTGLGPEAGPATPVIGMPSAMGGRTVTHSTNDLLWRNRQTGANVVWEMVDTVVLAYHESPVALPGDWEAVGVGNLLSGTHAVVWRNQATGENGVWQGRSSVFFPLPVVADQAWEIAAVGDLVGEPYADLVWRNASTGAIGVWEMDPNLNVANWHPLPRVEDSAWDIVGIGQLAGSTRPDIAWRNTVTGENGVWEMEGASVTRRHGINQVADTLWVIDAVGDFAGSGVADLLWRHRVSGHTVLWEMAGYNYVTWHEIGTVDAGWEVVDADNMVQVDHLGGFGSALIDGEVEQTEWAEALAFNTEVELGTYGEPLPTTLYFMTDSTNVYLAGVIETQGLEFSRGWFGWQFDSDHSGGNVSHLDDFVQFFDDIPAGLMTAGEFRDGAYHNCTLQGCGGGEDVYFGGTHDLAVAIYGSPDTIRYEMSHPLDSGDSLDISAAPGDYLGVVVITHLTDANGDGHQARTLHGVIATAPASGATASGLLQSTESTGSDVSATGQFVVFLPYHQMMTIDPNGFVRVELRHPH